MRSETNPTRFDVTEPLALHGGPKAKRNPFPLRKRHGELEKRYLSEVIDSDVLFFFIGSKVFEFQKRFAAMYGRKYCIACSSGTAAVQASSRGETERTILSRASETARRVRESNSSKRRSRPGTHFPKPVCSLRSMADSDRKAIAPASPAAHSTAPRRAAAS